MKPHRLILLCLLCLSLALPVFAQDSDQDGFPDGQDACPNRSAPNSTDGCPPVRNTPEPEQSSDRDGDGMIDGLDNCPNEGGPANNAGCPINVTPESQSSDSDGDGFPDGQDACPNQAGAAGGCDLVVIDETGDCAAATKGTARVNIRESANENAAIVGQLLPTESKLITGIQFNNTTPQNFSAWVQVDIGFINTGVIRLGGDCGNLVNDDEGNPTMTAEFALEWDCSTTSRVIITSDETPSGYPLGRVATYTPWLVYPDVLAPYPRPTEPDAILPGNILIGTPCDDLIIGTDSVDIIDGRGGNDMIIGLSGYDALVGGDGNDQIFGMTFTPLGGETGGNILVAGDGNDRLHASASGMERLEGGRGDDTLLGNPEDQLRGGDGNDRLSGSRLAIGGAGNDRISGTGADDTLYGNSGDDRIEAGLGNDVIDGGDNNDWLFGHRGDDTIQGGNGNDHINAHLGNDAAYGGEGDDWLSFYWGGLDIGEGNNGNDRIAIESTTFELLGLERSVFESERGEATEGSYFSGGMGDDYIHTAIAFRPAYVPIKGDEGNDRLRGGTYLDGGAGDDALELFYDTVAYGQDGNDSFAVVYTPYTAVLMYGGNGDDNMIGNRFVDLMFGEAGNDRLVGAYGSDYLNGGSGDDTLYGGMTLLRDGTGRFFTDAPNYVDSGSGRDTVDGGNDNPDARTRSDTCVVDGSDTVSSCEVRSWPGTAINLYFWQSFFDSFGI